MAITVELKKMDRGSDKPFPKIMWRRSDECIVLIYGPTAGAQIAYDGMVIDSRVMQDRGFGSFSRNWDIRGLEDYNLPIIIQNK